MGSLQLIMSKSGVLRKKAMQKWSQQVVLYAISSLWLGDWFMCIIQDGNILNLQSEEQELIYHL
jgi:hypothetical protein